MQNLQIHNPHFITYADTFFMIDVLGGVDVYSQWAFTTRPVTGSVRRLCVGLFSGNIQIVRFLLKPF